MLKTDSLLPAIKTAAPIGVKPLTADAIQKKYADRKRVGKTAKDRARGERKNGTAD